MLALKRKWSARKCVARNNTNTFGRVCVFVCCWHFCFKTGVVFGFKARSSRLFPADMAPIQQHLGAITGGYIAVFKVVKHVPVFFFLFFNIWTTKFYFLCAHPTCPGWSLLPYWTLRSTDSGAQTAGPGYFQHALSPQFKCH